MPWQTVRTRTYSPPLAAVESSSCGFALTRVEAERESFIDPELCGPPVNYI